MGRIFCHYLKLYLTEWASKNPAAVKLWDDLRDDIPTTDVS